jgi:hypothetical protein
MNHTGEAVVLQRGSGVTSPLANGFNVSATPGFGSKQASRSNSVLVSSTGQLNLDSSVESSSDSTAGDDDLVLDAALTRPALPYSQLPSGICYDARMKWHAELETPKDRSDYHPEDPRRIEFIYRTICDAGLVKDPNLTKGTLVDRPLKRIQAEYASRDEILTVHDAQHFEFLKESSGEAEIFSPDAVAKKYRSGRRISH